jgi:predicted HicB family RNase H-like nuclease
MAKRKSGITIYPDTELQKKLEKEAQKQRRSLNNFILFILASFFSKEHGKK